MRVLRRAGGAAPAGPQRLGTLPARGRVRRVAAIAGAILYYAVIAITNFEIGIVAIAIGYMVGYAVHRGAGLRGGRRFQILAVALTYWAVGLAYTPIAFRDVVQETTASEAAADAASGENALATDDAQGTAPPGQEANAGQAPGTDESSDTGFAGAIALLLGITFTLPVMAIAGSMPGGVISAAIIGFGMMQAWQMTGAAPVAVTGPYRINAGPSALA